MTDQLAALQDTLKGSFPDLLGIQFLQVTLECVKASLHVRPELCTIGGILHGGAIMAFADTLGAVATVMNLPAGKSTTTLESKTNFLRAALVGTTILAECVPLHRGSRTMVWQTRLMTEDGKSIAFVTQTQMVLD